jgi:hypothetical protein
MSSAMRWHFIRVNKGTVPPKAHLEDILKVYNTCFSACFIDEGKLQTHRVNETITNANPIAEVFEMLKDKAVLAAFGQCEDAYTTDDIQPFESMNGQINVFLDAPFDDYTHPDNPDSKHSRAFFAFHEYFQPEIESSAELADNDLEKVVNSLRSGAFKRKMDKELLKEGGSCLIFANNKTGEINQWCTNTTAVTTDWGWTSDDFSSPAQEEEVETGNEPEPVKPTSLLAKLGSVLSSKESEPAKTITKTEELKSSTAAVVPTVILWKPELEDKDWKKNWSNKKLKNRYYERCGQLPGDWINGVECRVLPKGNYKPKGFEVLQVVHNAPAPTKPVEDKKPEDKFPNTATRLPILSKQAHERMDGLLKDKAFKKYLDSSSINVMDPDIASKLEKRCPHLEEQRGMKPGETLAWPLEAYEALSSECPEEAGILLLNRAGQMIAMQRTITGLGTRLHKANKELIELKKKYEPESVTEEEKKVDKPATSVPATPPKPAVTPVAAARTVRVR